MADNIIVRKANSDDLQDILALLNSPDADNGHALQGHDANTIYQSILEDCNYFQIVASSEQALAGTLTLVIIMQMSHEGSSSAFITDVISKNNNVEVAMELLKYAAALAQEYGCFKTLLHCDYQQDMIAQACQQLGFKQNTDCYIAGTENSGETQ